MFNERDVGKVLKTVLFSIHFQLVTAWNDELHFTVNHFNFEKGSRHIESC